MLRPGRRERSEHLGTVLVARESSCVAYAFYRSLIQTYSLDKRPLGHRVSEVDVHLMNRTGYLVSHNVKDSSTPINFYR